MFTGLVDHCGVIQSIEKSTKTHQLTIQTTFEDLVLGESIAVDGACLTVTRFENQVFCCEVSPETEKLTVVEDYRSGRQVNLERALRLSDRLGGHFVMGHVDQTARILKKTAFEDYIELVVDVHEKRYLIPKGSIAINGVSLTLNGVSEDGQVKLMLIPHTLSKTNLAQLSVGDRVNIEFDWLAKIVQHSLTTTNLE